MARRDINFQFFFQACNSLQSEKELAKEEQEQLEKLEVFFLLLFFYLYNYVFFNRTRLLTLLFWEG